MCRPNERLEIIIIIIHCCWLLLLVIVGCCVPEIFPQIKFNGATGPGKQVDFFLLFCCYVFLC